MKRETMAACLAAGLAAAGLAAVNIDTGRQLFVDDCLVESARGVARHWNAPVKCEDPLVWPGNGAAPKVTDGTGSKTEPVNLTCATDGGGYRYYAR